MTGRGRRATTRADVARLAGVSTAVVSYVINNGPRGVSPHTRERVEWAIEQLEYRPNPSARALKTGTTGLIGVVVPETLNAYFAEFIEAIDAAARDRGSSIMLGITHEDPDREASLLGSLVDQGVDGLIINCRLVDESLYHINGARTPRVLLDRSLPVEGLTTIGADLSSGARMLTEHLVEHGHRRIGYIGGPVPRGGVDLRLAAWEEVVREHELPHVKPAITSWDREGGFEGTRQLLSHDDPPTAIFAASDFIAIGALRALYEQGRRIPEDVAVVSLDGTAEATYAWPALTTARQPFEEMSRLAVEALVAPEPRPLHTIVPMTLVLGASCGCRPVG